VRAVVDDRRGALARAGLGEVDADALAAADDGAGLHALGAEGADGGVANRVLRQLRDVPAVEPEVREAHGHVGLAAAERRLEVRRLEEPLVAGRAQPQHDFPERHDLLHACPRARRTLATMRRPRSTITS